LPRFAPIALAFLASCVSAFPAPTVTDVDRARTDFPDVTLEDLEKGRELYLAKCGACHRLKAPSELAPSAWPHAVADMADEAHLDDDERDAIVRYLVTMSAR
jgi:mono/diheme cytochrome c family protein